MDIEIWDRFREAAFETLLGKFKIEVRRTVNHGPDAPLWAQIKHWEEKFWEVIKEVRGLGWHSGGEDVEGDEYQTSSRSQPTYIDDRTFCASQHPSQKSIWRAPGKRGIKKKGRCQESRRWLFRNYKR